MTAAAVLLTAILAATAPVPQEADGKFARDVAAAREKAIKFLKDQQQPDGTWEGIVLNFLADIAYVPWILRARDRMGVELGSFPTLADWVERLAARPAVAAELDVVAAL